MNTLKLSNLLFLFIITILLLLSCTEECPEGYSGKDCATRVSDAIVGLYEGSENCGFVDEYAEVEIIRDNGPYAIFVNFSTFDGFTVNATVTEDSIFIQPKLLEYDQGGNTYYYFVDESKGSYSGDSLELDLIIVPAVSNPEKITCHYSLVK